MKLKRRIKNYIQNQWLMPRLTRKIAKEKAKRRAELIAKFEMSHEVRDLYNALTNTNFVPVGEHYLEASKIITLANQQTMVWIQCHLDGKLNRVYKEVNENDLEVLARKLTDPVAYVDEASNLINGALHALILEFGDQNQRDTNTPAPEFVPRIEKMLSDAVRGLREVE